MTEILLGLDTKRQESLLTEEDFGQILNDAQVLTGIPLSVSTVYVDYPEENTFTEFDANCVTKEEDGCKVAIVSLPRRFSSVQSEIEITAHELVHAVTQPAFEDLQSRHSAYVVQEVIADLVADSVRQKVMEDNRIKGSMEPLQYKYSMEALSHDQITEFLQEDLTNGNFTDPNNIGHILGFKLLTISQPLAEQYGIKRVIRELVRNPPTPGELFDLRMYRERLKTNLNKSDSPSNEFKPNIAPIMRLD